MTAFFGSRFGSRSKGDDPSQEPTQPRPLTNPRPTAISQQPLGFETVLGASSALEGKLKSEGNIRLDGIFTGTLEISGNVLVGETANITADIDAKNISIAGIVRGNVSGNKVQLLRTGKVWGNITASALTTEEGAFIEGKISMHSLAKTPTPTEINSDDDDITLPSIPVIKDELIVNIDDEVETSEVEASDEEEADSTEDNEIEQIIASLKDEISDHNDDDGDNKQDKPE